MKRVSNRGLFVILAAVSLAAVSLAAVFLAAVFPGPALAAVPCPEGQQNPSGLNNGNGTLAAVRVGLHAQTFNSSKACTANAPSQLGCDATLGTSNLVTTWPLDTRASVYIVALDIPTFTGLKGVTFGLDFMYDSSTYEGIYVNAFNLCMDLSFPSVTPPFPQEPGSGVVCTSAACLGTVADPTDPQEEAIVVIGWLDATGYTVATELKITPRLYLANPDFQTADCIASSSNPCYPLFAGQCSFGNPAGGYDPCVQIPVAVEPTTWGRIKSMGSGE